VRHDVEIGLRVHDRDREEYPANAINNQAKGIEISIFATQIGD
jgi:hypothetical protein